MFVKSCTKWSTCFTNVTHIACLTWNLVHTFGLVNACHNKNNSYRLFLKDRTRYAEHRYKAYKYKLTTILRCEKKKHYCTLLLKKKNKIPGTWKILRTIMGKMQKEHTYPELFHQDEKVIECKENIANLFNRFFTSVGPDLAKQINPPAGAPVFDYLKNRNDNSMFLSPVDENEVIRVVERCKNKSSTYAEGLSMNIVKHIITSIITPLTHIFNTSFKTGVFPDK